MATASALASWLMYRSCIDKWAAFHESDRFHFGAEEKICLHLFSGEFEMFQERLQQNDARPWNVIHFKDIDIMWRHQFPPLKGSRVRWSSHNIVDGRCHLGSPNNLVKATARWSSHEMENNTSTWYAMKIATRPFGIEFKNGWYRSMQPINSWLQRKCGEIFG